MEGGTPAPKGDDTPHLTRTLILFGDPAGAPQGFFWGSSHRTLINKVKGAA